MCGFLPPLGQQQFGSPNLRFFVFSEIRIKLKKMKDFSFAKIVAVAGILPPPFRGGLATSWHHFSWPPPQPPAMQQARGMSKVKLFFLDFGSS